MLLLTLLTTVEQLTVMNNIAHLSKPLLRAACLLFRLARRCCCLARRLRSVASAESEATDMFRLRIVQR